MCVSPSEPQGTIGKPTHLLLLYLAIATGAPLPLQSLDPPFKGVTEGAGVLDEFFQFRRVSLSSGFIGGVDGPRVEFGDAVDVCVELLYTVVDGGDLEWVGKARRSV